MPKVIIPAHMAVDAIFAVFFAPTGKKPPDADSLRPAIASWRDRYLTDPLRTGVATVQNNGWVSLQVKRAADISMPPVELLRQMGLGELEERILGAATHAVICASPGMNIRPRIGLWSALATALAVADHLQGIVFDPDSLSILRMQRATAAFTGQGTIAVSQHIMVPFSVGHDAGLGWMTTRGMGKFGLPDIELRDVPPNLDRLNVFMNSVAQLVLEAAFRSAEGTDGEEDETDDSDELSAEFQIPLPDELEIDGAAVARAHGGVVPAGTLNSTLTRVGLRFDPRGRAPDRPMILLQPPAGEPDPGVWLTRIGEALLGTPGSVRGGAGASDRMFDAHSRAMSELPYAKERYTSGLREGEVLYVKQGFYTQAGSREYIWLVVTGWTGSQIRGLLAHEPADLPSLKAGQTVTLDEAGLFDWMILMPGDRTEGGYTSTALMEDGEV